MDTIVINNKRFVIYKCNYCCDKCLFRHDSNYPHATYYCMMTKCYDFIVIKEVKVNIIDKIRMWFKKKMNKL